MILYAAARSSRSPSTRPRRSLLEMRPHRLEHSRRGPDTSISPTASRHICGDMNTGACSHAIRRRRLAATGPSCLPVTLSNVDRSQRLGPKPRRDPTRASHRRPHRPAAPGARDRRRRRRLQAWPRPLHRTLRARAPCAAVRFQTVTCRPRRSIASTIPLPSRPVPRNATRLMNRLPFKTSDSLRGRQTVRPTARRRPSRRATPPMHGATIGTHHQAFPARNTSAPQPATAVKSRGPKSRAGLIAYPELKPNVAPISTTSRPTITGASPAGARRVARVGDRRR